MRCESSGVLVPKDKAIKRFIVRNIVDASAIRDLQDSCAVEGKNINKNTRSLELIAMLKRANLISCFSHGRLC